jgi:hypothetical protein
MTFGATILFLLGSALLFFATGWGLAQVITNTINYAQHRQSLLLTVFYSALGFMCAFVTGFSGFQIISIAFA